LSLKERQRQEREQLILQAAEELLLECGYHDTSIDDVATRVGISKGTVYLHFASKEDLILALIQRVMQDFLQAISTILCAPMTPHEKLQAIIELTYGSLAGTHFQLFSTIFQSPELLTRLADKRQLAAAMRAELEGRLSAVLDEGKVSGAFDPTMPTPVLLTMFAGLLAPHGYERLVAQAQVPRADVVKHVCRFFFKGIAAETPLNHVLEGTGE
jgi:AcrR family transcriptional regulator